MILPRRRPEDLLAPRRAPLPPAIRRRAAEIVEAVRRRGLPAVERYARELDGLDRGAPLLLDRPALERALDGAPDEARRRLERVAGRIRRFAAAQRAALRDLEIDVSGGRAGHRFDPVERAGCYAPGGRYPLPSSVLMTAVTARVAGVETVWVASPRPAPVTVWAAAVAGVDGLLAAGGAHAVAALAYGAGDLPAADVVVGPGNLWVTAAKALVAGTVAIDLPAGPSELVVVADGAADPALVAADLLAQAEHDPEALPLLVTTASELATAVEEELERQLAGLPTVETARASLARGGAVVCRDRDELVRLVDAVAPEHLQLAIDRPEELAGRLRHYGALFLGASTAEVFGDYGVGPNHVLPTGGAARYAGGLSVLAFLRLRTWIAADAGAADPELAADTIWLARQEGLEAHARAAERRLPKEVSRS